MSLNSYPVFFLLSIISLVANAQEWDTYTPMFITDFNSNDFAKGESFGVNFSVDGVGFAANSTFESEDQLGFSLSYRPNLESNELRRTFLQLDNSFYFNAEFNIHLGNSFKERYNSYSLWRKYKKHYISLKPGVRIGYENNYDIALTWRREAFNVNTKHRAFVFDVGGRLLLADDILNISVSDHLNLYLRIAWNWFVKKE